MLDDRKASILRAVVESFRGDYPVYYLGGHVTPAQLLSAAILATGSLLLWKLSGVKSAVVAQRSDVR